MPDVFKTIRQFEQIRHAEIPLCAVVAFYSNNRHIPVFAGLILRGSYTIFEDVDEPGVETHRRRETDIRTAIASCVSDSAFEYPDLLG